MIKDLNNGEEVYNTTSFGALIEGMKNVPLSDIPLIFPATGTPFILGEAQPFKFKTEEWTQNELFLINNVISLLSKGVFSPALVSSIVKSSLLYAYLQADILQVLQSKFDTSLAESFLEKTKAAIKDVVNSLQNNHLI